MRSSAKRQSRPPLSLRRAPAVTADERASLSEFAQIVAHRIGGLVSSIEGFTDLLLDGIDRPEDRENAFRILESVSRIEAILHDLKHYEDEIEIRASEMTLDQFINGILSVLADSEASRLKIHVTAPTDLTMQFDERLIRQALLSVIRNALEATAVEKSAVTLRAFTSDRIVTFEIENEGRIEDTSNPERVFDAFYTTKAHNLGLGLTMSRRFARVHGGDLVVADDEGPRTCFHLSLPLKATS